MVVRNTWMNRLIGELNLSEAERKTWTTNPATIPVASGRFAGACSFENKLLQEKNNE